MKNFIYSFVAALVWLACTVPAVQAEPWAHDAAGGVTLRPGYGPAHLGNQPVDGVSSITVGNVTLTGSTGIMAGEKLSAPVIVGTVPTISGSIGTVQFITGTASPSGVLTAPIGVVDFVNTGTSVGVYYKNSGTGTSGWLTLTGT